MISFLNEVLEREVILEEVQGSAKFLEKMAKCDWNEKIFLRFKPGQKILQEYFFK